MTIIRALFLLLCFPISLSGCIIVTEKETKRTPDGRTVTTTSWSASSASNSDNGTIPELDAHSDIYVIGKSAQPFDETLADLTAAIEARPFTLFATVDHAAGAARVGKSLPPTTLIIFGNPEGGTPLMQENRYLGMELPLKAMVWEEDDEVYVAMTRIRHLADAFDLAGVEGVVDTIEKTLEAVMTDATHE